MTMPEPSQSADSGAREALPVPATIGRESIPAPTSAASATESTAVATPEPGSGSTNIDHRLKFAEETHQYIREYIRLADQKATFFFTGGTALLAFLYNKGVSTHWLKPLMTWNILDVTAFLAMAALSFAILASLLVVIPRTPGSLRGYLFWEAIAEFESARAYADDLSQMSSASLFQIKTEHSYELARVCRRKYKLLRLALRVGAVGLGAALAVFLLL